MTSLKKDNFVFMVPGEASSLAAIRWVVTRLARASGLSDDQVDQIEVAVDEVCANVIEHAYCSLLPKPPIHLEIQAGKEHFMIDVIDCGSAFDYDSFEDPKIPDHWLEGHERGVGILLIRKCMDEVLYDVLPDARNRMRLIKNRATAPVPEAQPDPV